MLKEIFTPDLYTGKKYSMSILKANLVAIAYPIPLVIVYIASFLAINSLRSGAEYRLSFSIGGNISSLLLGLFLYFAGFFILIVLHEITHAVFFLRGCEQGRKSIVFGIKYATPYCHCTEVITASAYRRSLLAPLFTICLPLALASFITGNILVFLAALSMIFGSGGDLAVFWMIHKYPGKSTFVWDMDDEVGCIVYEPVQNDGK